LKAETAEYAKLLNEEKMEWWEEPDQPVVPSLSRNLDLLSIVDERPRFFDKLRMTGVGAQENGGEARRMAVCSHSEPSFVV
jgi:hypothetical protein